MAKLQPLLNHCKFFMKCVFVLSFYNALYCRFLYGPLCRVFANQVTNVGEFVIHQVIPLKLMLCSIKEASKQEWHIFVILIVSCISTLVTPRNLSFIASIGMEMYKSPLKFLTDHMYISQDMVFLKSWFPYILYCGGQGGAHHNTKCMGKP